MNIKGVLLLAAMSSLGFSLIWAANKFCGKLARISGGPESFTSMSFYDAKMEDIKIYQKGKFLTIRKDNCNI